MPSILTIKENYNELENKCVHDAWETQANELRGIGCLYLPLWPCMFS